MRAAVGLDDVADLANEQGTGGVLEGLHHLPGPEWTKVAAVTERATVAAAGSLIREVRLALLDVVQDNGELSNGCSLGNLGGGFASAAADGVAATLVLDEDVRCADLGHLRWFEVLNFLIVGARTHKQMTNMHTVA